MRGGFIVALVLSIVAPVDAQVLPTGFVDVPVATGLLHPIAINFLPDGRLIIAERTTHAVKILAAGSVGVIGVVPDVSTNFSHRGLLGIAIDPQWPSRPYLYALFSSSTGPSLRLAMYPLAGDLSSPTSTNLALGPEYAILTDLPDQDADHNGGAVRFGADGRLYLSLGDDADPCSAQDPSSLKGKILRIDVSALPLPGLGPPQKNQIAPSDNPFAAVGGNAALVWALGLRNPFRFHIDVLTGRLFVADVGESAFEEIDCLESGGQNLGWPFFEGNIPFSTCGAQPPMLQAPIAVVPHAGVAAIISLGTYRNPSSGALAFGQNYEGDFFFADFYAGTIRRLRFDGANWITPPAAPGQPSPDVWASGVSYIADATVGPDGAIYYAKLTAGSIRRIQPSQQGGDCGNPVTLMTGSTITPTSSAPGLVLAPCGTIQNVRWYWLSNDTPCSRQMTLSTCHPQTDVDTRIAVFEGLCSSLTAVACDSGHCQGKAELTFEAAAGTGYRVAVGSGGQTGTIELSLAIASTAAAVQIGTGCGATPPPTLNGAPMVLGSIGTITISDAAPSSTGLFFASIASGFIPVPGGCSLLLSNGELAILFLFSTNSTGGYELSVPIPADPSLVGFELLLQALIVPSGFAGPQTTNALYVRFDC